MSTKMSFNGASKLGKLKQLTATAAADQESANVFLSKADKLFNSDSGLSAKAEANLIVK